jgi:transposase InsO family protein
MFFKTLHAFVIVHHESRRVVHVGVTDHPTDEWITQQVRDATPFEEKPTYLICDNDKRYGSMFERVAQASGIEVIHTPFEAPRANAICERFVGSLRRECLDHVLVIGGLYLIRILKEYVTYFDQARPHQGIGQRIPAPRVSLPGEVNARKVMAFPVLNGLHHDYRWTAA